MNNNNKYNTYLNNFISYLTNNKRYSPYTITSYKKDTYDYLEFLKKNYPKDLLPESIAQLEHSIIT